MGDRGRSLGCAAASTLEEGQSYTTVELKTNFCKPVWTQRLTATGSGASMMEVSLVFARRPTGAHSGQGGCRAATTVRWRCVRRTSTAGAWEGAGAAVVPAPLSVACRSPSRNRCHF